MSAFSRGSRVRLRSGSPDMCVTGVYGGESDVATIAVAWFSATGEYHRADFPADALEPSPSLSEEAVATPEDALHVEKPHLALVEAGAEFDLDTTRRN